MESVYQNDDLPDVDDLPEKVGDTEASNMMINDVNDDATSNELWDDELKRCTFTRKGVCNQHGVLGMKITIPSKKWTKLRGGTYGYRTTRVTRYRCSARKSDQKVPDNLREESTENSQRFRDSGHAVGT